MSKKKFNFPLYKYHIRYNLSQLVFAVQTNSTKFMLREDYIVHAFDFGAIFGKSSLLK